jgi:hypothetical protein
MERVSGMKLATTCMPVLVIVSRYDSDYRPAIFEPEGSLPVLLTPPLGVDAVLVLRGATSGLH